MDLKRLRTFVEVADLGTVSKAALRLRISQSALSRQISDLEYECGFKLFDRIGRRLFLTTRGGDLLEECRAVLGQLGSLGERIELLKRGDAGVLKVAAPPQTIESVLSGFLPRFAERFPNVRVRLTEALGMDQVPLLERGEVHIGIRHDQGVNPWFDSLSLPSDDVLAVLIDVDLETDEGAELRDHSRRSLYLPWWRRRVIVKFQRPVPWPLARGRQCLARNKRLPRTWWPRTRGRSW